MSEFLPQQLTGPNLVDGLISTDPWRLQCRACGVVDTKPDDRGVALWIILADFRFCLVDGVRRCPKCRVEHQKTCDRCARS